MFLARRTSLFLPLVVVASCAQPEVPLTEGPPTIRTKGFAGNTLFDGLPVGPDLTPHKLLETDVFFATRATNLPGQNYLVILGKNESDMVNAQGSFKVGSVTFVLDSGWVYLYGKGPMVETDRTEAGAEGSELVVRIHDDKHWVALVDGSKGHVKPKIGAEVGVDHPFNKGKFVTVDSAGAVSAPAAIGTNADLQAFISNTVLPLAGHNK